MRRNVREERLSLLKERVSPTSLRTMMPIADAPGNTSHADSASMSPAPQG